MPSEAAQAHGDDSRHSQHRELANNCDAPPAQTPPPPGFAMTSLSSGTSRNGISASPSLSPHICYDGAAIRAEGTVSAPPPPGFGSAPDQQFGHGGTTRLDLARGLLSGRGRIVAFPHSNKQNQDQKNRPSLLHPSAVTGGENVLGVSGPVVCQEGTRTTSFTNLAAALGEGLAESMDISLERKMVDRRNLHKSSFMQVESTSNPTNGCEQAQSRRIKQSASNDSSSLSLSASQVETSSIDNMSRQSRQAASRLIGSINAAPMETKGCSMQHSSSTGATIIPARVLHSTDGLSATSLAVETDSSTSLISAAKSHRSAPVSTYPSSLHAHPVRNSHIGVTVEEPRSRTASPAMPTQSMRSLSFAHSESAAVSVSEISAAPPVMNSGDGSSATTMKSTLQDYVSVPSTGNHTLGHGGNQLRHQLPANVSFLKGPPEPCISKNNLQMTSSAPSPLPPISGRNYTQGIVSSGLYDFELYTEQDLAPFTWDVAHITKDRATMAPSSRTPSPIGRSSRGLAIFQAFGLHMPDVRSTCEAFGSLLSFRHEFCSQRGVIFVTYHDLRSARLSATELSQCLWRLDSIGRGGGGVQGKVKVRYCVPLNSSSIDDESMILLENMPHSINELELQHVLTSYGAVRSVCVDPMDRTGRSYIVEFYDIQDARQALLEIESTQPFGLDVGVAVCKRSPVERKQGQELLAMVGRWRREGQHQAGFGLERCSPSQAPSPFSANSGVNFPKGPSPSGTSDSSSPLPQAPDMSIPRSGVVSAPGIHLQTVASSAPGNTPLPGGPSHPPTPQLTVGPDGQYSYVVVGSVPPHLSPHHQTVAAPYVQNQIVHGPQGAYLAPIPAHIPVHHHGQHPQYVIHHTAAPHPAHPTTQYHHFPQSTVVVAPQFNGHHHGYATLPLYTSSVAVNQHSDSSAVGGNNNGHHFFLGHRQQHVGGVDLSSTRSGKGAGRSGVARSSIGGQNESAQLLLDIEAVKSGKNTNTSLMVRNIPNKYTQKMLLAEFAEGGHSPDKIDFFYLPIDFKNKCNRGYAFVNFVDHCDIVSFHSRYNGKRWRVFNSDKICNITYARIQGKAAMMKRFQNSALMEKDDEYKPLVFVSHGADKGDREEFPPSLPKQQIYEQQPASLSSLAAASRDGQIDQR